MKPISLRTAVPARVPEDGVFRPIVMLLGGEILTVESIDEAKLCLQDALPSHSGARANGDYLQEHEDLSLVSGRMTCPICGHGLLWRHCKAVCPGYGYVDPVSARA